MKHPARIVSAVLCIVIASCGDGVSDPTTATVPPTTLAPTVATTATTAPAAPAHPATADELVTALYAALNAKDDAAFRALSAPGAHHTFFYDFGQGAGMFPAGFDHSASALVSTATTSIEVIGDVIEFGDVLAIPVRYTHPNEVDTGYDVLIVERSPQGLLIAGGATLYAAPGLEPDPTTAEVVGAEVAAWNAGDVAGVMALMDEVATMWDDLGNPESKHRGAALELFIDSSLWFQVELDGEFSYSGPFAAVPTRLITATDSSEGITLYLIRDGRIILQGFAQG
jgi:hypothetical protein